MNSPRASRACGADARAPLAPFADPVDYALLNDWQQAIPLVERPYEAMGAAIGIPGAEVRARLAAAIADGRVSRVGATFGAGVGAGLLCAMRVAPARLAEAAAIVDAHPAVNHDYERAHAWNLWFVVTGPDAAHVERTVTGLEQRLARPILRLPMIESYRIDLGFDLVHDAGDPVHARASAADERDARVARGAGRARACVERALRPLAAALERGVPLVERPYAALGTPLGLDDATVRATIAAWRASGVLRRFGVIVRHHELGLAANAMLVIDVHDRDPADVGRRLAAQPGVNLCYRRARAPQWPYDVYCMFHGRARDEVQARIERALDACGLADAPHEVLHTVRRFKQTGSRYFADVMPVHEAIGAAS